MSVLEFRPLLAKGHRDFPIVVVGEGTEEIWLRRNMRQAEFTGVLTDRDLSRAFANLDVLDFKYPQMGFKLVEKKANGAAVISTLETECMR